MQKLAIHYLQKTKDRFPYKIAIVDGEQSITFIELWNNSIALAYWINMEFKISNTPVVVNIAKSIDAVVAQLAVQLSGNIYVPFDVETPIERKKSILKTLNSNHILEKSSGQFQLNEKLCFPDAISSSPSSFETEVLKNLSTRSANDPLYIIFTSGTTGVPKGVTISNASVIDYIDWATETYEISEAEIIGNSAPFYFDNSVLDLYLTLAKGCTLHLLPQNVLRFPVEFGNYISGNRINFIFFVPSVLNNLIALKVFKDFDLSCLRKVLFAGEPMPLNTLKTLRRELPGTLLSNLYGPTEITVDAIYWIFGDELDSLEQVPLGIPCSNHRILFMDENENIVTSENETAEICVAGPGVALGYWNDPEMTRQVFIASSRQDEIIYKTGDLGYKSNGLIYMTGRKDDQFKYLGYRIEAGEIENALNQLDGIQQSCVFYDDEQKRIIAFYTTETMEYPTQFRNLLSSQLPQYMIPHRFQKLDQFPITSNGKLDRKTLRETEMKARNAIS